MGVRKAIRWKLDPSTGCWVWVLCVDKDGYGSVWSGERKGSVPAHRWAYESFVGPIPPGLTVDHLCLNRPCVNPAHLRLLTHSVNASGNSQSRLTHCKHGHEFTPENTHLGGATGRVRTCRSCSSARSRAYKARKKASS